MSLQYKDQANLFVNKSVRHRSVMARVPDLKSSGIHSEVTRQQPLRTFEKTNLLALFPSSDIKNNKEATPFKNERLIKSVYRCWFWFN